MVPGDSIRSANTVASGDLVGFAGNLMGFGDIAGCGDAMGSAGARSSAGAIDSGDRMGRDGLAILWCGGDRVLDASR